MAKWTKGTSGNPLGRPRGERTITALLQRSGSTKKRSSGKLIGMANGEGELDPAIQLSAMKLILGYIDGLPSRAPKSTAEKESEIKVLYVNPAEQSS